MKVVYIAGPYRAENNWLIERNVRRAEDMAFRVWQIGAACICPHANTRFFQYALPDETFLKGDLAILKNVDAVLTVRNWSFSEGAQKEVESAKEKGIPVFNTFSGLSQWLYTKGEI